MNHPGLRRYIRHGTLVQLSVFDTVARLLNFTKAAQQLHMAQPTVSMHMKRLAETCGIALFEQHGRGVRLTEAGRELHAACQDIFQKILDVESRLATLRTASAGRLKLAVSTSGKYFAPRLLARFWEANPGLEVALTLANHQSLVNRLAADNDDFYLFSDVPEDPEDALEVVSLMPNRLHLYARDDHPLAGRKAIALSMLAEEKILLREPGSGTRAAAEVFFATHGFAPHVRLELGSNEAIKQAILEGLGVAILSASTMAPETRRGHIVALDVAGLPIERRWTLVRRRARPLSDAARTFLAHVRAASAGAELAEMEAN